VTKIKASEARQEFFRLLDAVERGETVVVERKGTRFKLSLLAEQAVTVLESPVRVTDPDVMSGDWTWVGDSEGQLQFEPRPRR